MRLIGDFETYYDKEFNLKQIPAEIYVRDPRFQIIGFAYKLGKDQPKWLIGENNIQNFFRSLDWNKIHFVAHNARFDGLILTNIFKCFPKYISCTLSMAAAAGVSSISSLSLKSVGDKLQATGISIPCKGTTVSLASGAHLEDMPIDFLNEYGQYAIDDVIICEAAYDYFEKILPKEELAFQDTILKAGIEPRVSLNRHILLAERKDIIERETSSLLKVADILGLSGDKSKVLEEVRSNLRSKRKLLDILTRIGGVLPAQLWSMPADKNNTVGFVMTGKSFEEYKASLTSKKFIIPLKLSVPSTLKNKQVTLELAKSKQNSNFLALTEHDDDIISSVAQCALSMASSLPLTRCESLLRFSEYPTVSVPINIAGAHTQRMSGADGINVQNLPSGRKGKSKALRVSIEAPKGKVFVAGDASQIEARLVAYICKENFLLETFANKGDPYAMMASKMFDKPVEKILDGYKNGDPDYTYLRFVGKFVILSKNYGAGEETTLKRAKDTYGITLSAEMNKFINEKYRETNANTVAMWKYLDSVIKLLSEPGNKGFFGGEDDKLFYYDSDHKTLGQRTPGILTPWGTWVIYPKLHAENEGHYASGNIKYGYHIERYRHGRPEKHRVYGAKVLENITQALAIAIGKFQINLLKNKYQFVLNEHDAWVFLANESDTEQALDDLIKALSTNPPWLPSTCVLACSAGFSHSYGLIDK